MKQEFSLHCWWSSVCVEPTPKKRVTPLIVKGKSFIEFPEVIMRLPTYFIGLTFLVTRQCGEASHLRWMEIFACYFLYPAEFQKNIFENIRPVKHITEDWPQQKSAVGYKIKIKGSRTAFFRYYLWIKRLDQLVRVDLFSHKSVE